MKPTNQKISLFLINTKDHETTKREILRHIGYRKDFESVYDMMLRAHVLEERGRGTKYDPKIVHLLDPKAGFDE